MKRFEDVVRAMTAKEIIMAMVEALTIPPIININMSTYGHVEVEVIKKGLLGIGRKVKKTCFGCAATNTICKISGKVFNTSNIASIGDRAELVSSDERFLRGFEKAINALRLGDLSSYNWQASNHGFAKITILPNRYLPVLNNNYTNDHLISYIQLANNQL